jgi:hypothetical protein
MNNVGNPSNVLADDATMPEDKPKRAGANRWLLLGVIGIFLVLGGILLIQFVPILLGIVSPPMPPLPADAQQISHHPIEHGVDEWTYESSQHACVVQTYYSTLADSCRGTVVCNNVKPTDPLPTNQVVAQCTGHMDFSMFTMQWIATIAADGDGLQSVFQISRETFWGGKIPPVKMEELLEEAGS